ncbi:MAG: peptidoglycan/LPS O-acetylase OafA/YrhL [Oleiphilaceae bacterium]|jgi:peptidoglycan/LPS O-acetylase OafA/YrhL
MHSTIYKYIVISITKRILIMKSRNLEIDTLRGIACILLVAYHVIGSSGVNGLKISDGFYRDINDVLAYLRMPLFTFLSGIVYAYRPFESDAKSFLLKKARRLLIPMLIVGTIFVLLQAITSGANSGIANWYLLHIKPVAHFWFIESLFLLFILIVALEKIHLLDNLNTFLLVLAVMIILYVSPIQSNYFSFSGFLYLSPYFLIGMGMLRYKIIGKVNQRVSLMLALLVTIPFLLIYTGDLPMFARRSLPSLIIGSISCITLLSIGLKSGVLARIGMFSYSIYLFHVFFTASSRILLNKMGIFQLELVFAISLIFGSLGPIAVDVILGKVNFGRVFFLGKSPLKNYIPQSI